MINATTIILTVVCALLDAEGRFGVVLFVRLWLFAHRRVVSLNVGAAGIMMAGVTPCHFPLWCVICLVTIIGADRF